MILFLKYFFFLFPFQKPKLPCRGRILGTDVFLAVGGELEGTEAEEEEEEEPRVAVLE